MEQELATTLARTLGLRFDDGVVLNRGTNVLVHLRPTSVVARVTRLAHLVRSPDALAGGIAFARALGSRAVAPSTLIDAGPHVSSGRYVTFWSFRTGDTATPREAGRALRELHEAAPTLDTPLRACDPCQEAIRVADLIGGDTGKLLRSIAQRLAFPELPVQPIHGDAHFENVLAGGVWQDFDEACSGPRDWDVASMIHRWVVFGEREDEMRAALAAYGPYDRDAVERLQPLVTLGIAAWGSLAPLIGETAPRTAHRLEWLQRN